MHKPNDRLPGRYLVPAILVFVAMTAAFLVTAHGAAIPGPAAERVTTARSLTSPGPAGIGPGELSGPAGTSSVLAPDSSADGAVGADDIARASIPARQVEPVVSHNLPASDRLPAPDGTLRQANIPVLIFHHVGELPAEADEVRRDLTVSPGRFEEYLRYLKSAGFQSMGLREVYLHLAAGLPLPEKPIVLTFDDGYLDNYQVAFPLLKQYGFKGAFFIITNFVDDARPEYASWDQLREMHAAGMEIEAHSRNHPDLRGRDLDFLIYQLLGPAEAIAAHIGERPRFFAYPSGKYDERVVEVLRSANYMAAVTVSQGAQQSSDRLFEIERIRVRGEYQVPDLAGRIHRWINGPEEPAPPE